MEKEKRMSSGVGLQVNNILKIIENLLFEKIGKEG